MSRVLVFVPKLILVQISAFSSALPMWLGPLSSVCPVLGFSYRILLTHLEVDYCKVGNNLQKALSRPKKHPGFGYNFRNWNPCITSQVDHMVSTWMRHLYTVSDFVAEEFSFSKLSVTPTFWTSEGTIFTCKMGLLEPCENMTLWLKCNNAYHYLKCDWLLYELYYPKESSWRIVKPKLHTDGAV